MSNEEYTEDESIERCKRQIELVDESIERCERQIEFVNNTKLTAIDKNIIDNCDEKLKSLEEEHADLLMYKIKKYKALQLSDLKNTIKEEVELIKEYQRDNEFATFDKSNWDDLKLLTNDEIDLLNDYECKEYFNKLKAYGDIENKKYYQRLNKIMDERRSREEFDTWFPIIAPFVGLFILWIVAVCVVHLG